MKHLILGGARSGKSQFAEQQAINSQLTRHYIATGQAFDKEMNDRIQQHQAQRDNQWLLIEEPLQLATALLNHDKKKSLLTGRLPNGSGLVIALLSSGRSKLLATTKKEITHDITVAQRRNNSCQ